MLLWLAIGLLPLRGFAAVLMPAHDAPSRVAASDTAPLCHGAMQAADDAATGDAPAATSAGTCSLCDLCHSSALGVAASALALSALEHSAPPAWRAATPAPPTPDGLFRPPRSRLG